MRVLCALALVLAACASTDAGTRSFDDPLPARAESDEWVLVFADEFDEPVVDTLRWSARTGDLGHKATLNSGSPSMASVREGSLFVSAEPTPDDQTFPYTAGYLETRGLFAQTYGKVEFRVRCQYAPGLWYAVWGRPWKNAVPEIDIEFLAENVNQVWFVNHWDLPPLPADERRVFTTVNGMHISDFHTYTVTWKPDLVEWDIDGRSYMRVTDRGVPHEPVFWIMNAWVGGWGGKPSASTQFPAHFEIDWFRVYRLKEWPVAPSIQIANPRLKYTTSETIDIELADFSPAARVEVREGDTLVGTLSHAPFKWTPSLSGKHTLRFVGTDGARSAEISEDVSLSQAAR